MGVNFGRMGNRLGENGENGFAGGPGRGGGRGGGGGGISQFIISDYPSQVEVLFQVKKKPLPRSRIKCVAG